MDGRFVIPALADLHSHTFGNGNPTGSPHILGPQGTVDAALYNGVAFVLDLFSDERSILGFRDGQRAGKEDVTGAMLFAAGPCFTATDGHCSQYGVPTRIVNSPEDARREVSDLAPSRPDILKIVYDHQSYNGRSMPTVDRATLVTFIETGQEHGLKTVVHVGTWQDARDAALAGADAVTHTPGPDSLPDDLAAVLFEAGTMHIPTLAVQSDFARFVDNPELLEDPLLAETVPTALLAAYQKPPSGEWPPLIQGWLAWLRPQVEPNMQAVRTLSEAGVPMLTGTDGGNFGVFQGYSVHRELELLVQAGLSPWTALRGATTEASRLLDHAWGVAEGDEATLLVLDASPIESIANTKTIHAVIQRGVVVDRGALRR